MNRSLEEQMGGMLVCDQVHLGVVGTSSSFSCDKCQCSLVLETPGGKICDNRAPLGGSVLRQIGRVQREPRLVFTISRGLTAEDNGYIQVAYMVLAYSVTLHKGQLRQRVKRKGL